MDTKFHLLSSLFLNLSSHRRPKPKFLNHKTPVLDQTTPHLTGFGPPKS